MARIIDRIESAEVEEAVLADMVEFALDMPEVKRRVQERVELRVEEIVQERRDLTAELSNLREELHSVRTRLRSAEQATKRQADETTLAVKLAFDKALSNGAETLASAAIFDVLTRRLHRYDEGRNAEARGPVRSLVRGLPSTGAEDLLRILMTCGLSRRFAVVLIAASSCAWRSGLMVFLKGRFARQVTLAIAGHRANASVVEIPIGLTVALDQISIVVDDPKVSTLVLLNANVSDLGIYGATLLDFIVESSAGRIVRPELEIIGSLNDTQFSLDLPAETDRFGITIDLDWSPSFELSPDSRESDWFQDVVDSSGLEKNICKKLIDEVMKLGDLEQHGVTAMIARALSKNDKSVGVSFETPLKS
jgi:hypothetical protein